MWLAVSTPTVATQLFGSGLIGLREGLETGIVVMILAAFLVKSGRREHLKWLWLGVGAAVIMVLAVFAGIHYGTSTISGTAAEAVAGVASLAAVCIVTWMVLWIRGAAQHISSDLRESMTAAVQLGGAAVVSLSFLAVGREGVETALLMVGYAENSSATVWPLMGLVLGILVAVVVTFLLYFGAVRINLATFFSYTGALLVVVASGILAYGLRALQTAGWLPGGNSLAFDASAHYDQSSWYGATLQGLFNIRPDPTIVQLVGWAVYLVVVMTLFVRPRFLGFRSGAASSSAAGAADETPAS